MPEKAALQQQEGVLELGLEAELDLEVDLTSFER